MSYIPKEPTRGLDNPLFALWALPFELHQSMMTAWWDACCGSARVIGSGTATIERSKGPTDSHLAVPAPLATKDTEIFA